MDGYLRSWVVLAIAATAALCSACQKPPAAAASATPGPATTALSVSGSASSGSPAAAGTPAQVAAAPPNVCNLLTASEVGAIVGKKVVQDGCTYGLDPAAKEATIAGTRRQMDAATGRAARGDLDAMMKGMMQMGSQMAPGGAGSAAMMDQLTVTVDAARDQHTEDEVKGLYAKTGAMMRGAAAPLAPEQRGLSGMVEGFDELAGVGDWAFGVNVATASMPMLTIRGRVLEAHRGPWHVTINATVAPDPGAAALDAKLSSLARALIARLPAS